VKRVYIRGKGRKMKIIDITGKGALGRKEGLLVVDALRQKLTTQKVVSLDFKGVDLILVGFFKPLAWFIVKNKLQGRVKMCGLGRADRYLKNIIIKRATEVLEELLDFEPEIQEQDNEYDKNQSN
jgi:hypothetical protein